MAGDINALLSAIGFAGSDALSELGIVQRQLDLGKATLEQTGQAERRGIDTGYESRGLYRSGARGNDLARQRVSESQRGSALEAAAAGDVAGIQRFLNQQQTLSQAADLKSNAGYGQSLDDLLHALGIAREDTAYLQGQGSLASTPGLGGGGGYQKPKAPGTAAGGLGGLFG